jgi:hypothetical protein
MGNWLFNQTDNLTTLIGYMILAGGSIIAYRQWRAEQVWRKGEASSRRQEMLSARVDSFYTPATRNAILMMLSYERDILLWPGEELTKVSWDDCARALIPALFREYLYDQKEIATPEAARDGFPAAACP